MDRRRFLLMLIALSSVPAVLATARDATAKDGSNDDDSDDGDDDGGDDSDSGGGSGSSGSGGGDDDSGSDDSDDDDSDDDSGSGGSKSGRDHQKAREAVGQGRILPLREILKRVEEMGGGRVIAVNLDLDTRRPFYTLKIQRGDNVRTLKLDAASGRRLTLFGW